MPLVGSDGLLVDIELVRCKRYQLIRGKRLMLVRGKRLPHGTMACPTLSYHHLASGECANLHHIDTCGQ